MQTDSKKRLIGSFCLFLAAFLWGTSFIAQKVGMREVDGFTFNGIRTMIGAATLVPLIIFRRAKSRGIAPGLTAEEKKSRDRTQLICGVITGVILCIASNLQQFAFKYIDSGKVAFITALYMLLVPLLGLIIGKRQPFFVWIALVFGCVGVYLLCVNGELGGIGPGELLSLSCSVFFAIHILYVDYAVQRSDPIILSFTQFVVCGILSIICMLLFEHPTREAVRTAILPIIYSGVLSSGAAFTLQIVGQKNTEPAVASLLLCLESVFAVLAGGIVLHERLTGREIAGCIIMFTAVVITNLPVKPRRPGDEKAQKA